MTCPDCERNKYRAALWRAEAYKQAGHGVIERKWVGLTRKERSDLWWGTDMSGMPEHDYGKAIEAKLKEKNT